MLWGGGWCSSVLCGGGRAMALPAIPLATRLPAMALLAIPLATQLPTISLATTTRCFHVLVINQEVLPLLSPKHVQLRYHGIWVTPYSFVNPNVWIIDHGR